MRAAVLEQAGKPLSIEEVDIEAPHAGEVAVAVHACGICHSDLSVIDGAFPGVTPGGARPRGGRCRDGDRRRRHDPGGRRPRRPHPVRAVRPLLLVRPGRVEHLHQQRRADDQRPPRRRHPAVPQRRDRLAGHGRRRVRRAGGHPGDRRGEDRRRRAARRRLRDRLRGADRRRRRHQHRRAWRPARPPSSSASAASASRSSRARCSPGRRASSSAIRWPSDGRRRSRMGATDALDPTTDDVVAKARRAHRRHRRRLRVRRPRPQHADHHRPRRHPQGRHDRARGRRTDRRPAHAARSRP